MTIEELVAGKGGKYNAGTLALTAADGMRYIVVNEDATFTTLTDTADTDVKAEWNFTTETITKGMILSPKSGLYFKSVIVATGSVFVIKA